MTAVCPCHTGAGAPFLLTLDFAIALPDSTAIFARAVPDLAAEDVAAIAADDTAGEAASAGDTPALFPALQFLLHMVKQLSANDGWMASLHVIPGHFPPSFFFIFLVR